MSDLRSTVAVRQQLLWTNREIINGVIDLKESMLSDSLLQDIISSVMNDVKSWLLLNDINYDRWTNLLLAPRAVIRATTFAVVASVYARRIRAPMRTLTKTAPMDVKEITDTETAMEYWESKMLEALTRYRSSISISPFTVDTTYEDPLFTINDLPKWT
jgi:hypothetical protein